RQGERGRCLPGGPRRRPGPRAAAVRLGLDRDRLRGSRRRPTKSGVITQDWYNTDGGSLVVRAHDHGDLTSCVGTSSAGSPCLAHITVRFSGMAWPPSLGVWTKNR